MKWRLNLLWQPITHPKTCPACRQTYSTSPQLRELAADCYRRWRRHQVMLAEICPNCGAQLGPSPRCLVMMMLSMNGEAVVFGGLPALLLWRESISSYRSDWVDSSILGWTWSLAFCGFLLPGLIAGIISIKQGAHVIGPFPWSRRLETLLLINSSMLLAVILLTLLYLLLTDLPSHHAVSFLSSVPGPAIFHSNCT